MMGLFLAWNMGEFSSSVSSTKVDLQAEVRRTMDWITKDVRQSVSWEIADAVNNNPSDTHIKFRQVQGWNTTSDTYLLNGNYTEYTYNAGSNTITRRVSDASNNTLQTWNFNNIMQAPFYTRDSGSNTVPLTGHSSDLLTSRRLIIVIAGQKQVRGSTNTTYALTEEVKVRNE
jgi:hypothetical protein